MGKIRLNLSTLNKGAARDIKDAIDFGVRHGATRIGDGVVDVAQNRLRQAGAVWRGILQGSFDWRVEERPNGLAVIARNDAEHARTIEFGRTPGAEAPPLAPLIPWVRTKMVGFNLENVESLPEPEEMDTEAEVKMGNEFFTIDLAEFTDRTTLQKAFWLQQHIKKEGIDAVQYMQAAEMWAETDGADEIKDSINRRLRML